MAAIKLKLQVRSIHGEGERAVAKKYARIDAWVKAGSKGPGPSVDEVDPAPDVLVTCRVERDGAGGEARLELPLTDWDEVEAFKALPGTWDSARKQWRTGAELTLTIE